MKALISIIVPIYNVERYIERCVDSIIHSDYDDYELILVNDGSTDSSRKIISKYKTNPNVIIVDKTNGGLSSARNAGIRKASGDYLMFIDGDDFLRDNNCLSKIAKEIKKSKADVVQYKMVRYYERQNKYISDKCIIDKPTEHEKNKVIRTLNRTGKVSISACDKVVKRNIIVENSLYFKDGLLSEDLLWSLQLYEKINTISVIDENIYVYRQQRQGSISTTKGSKLARDLFSTINYWKEYKYKTEEEKTIYFNIISYWYILFRTLFGKKQYTSEMINSFSKNDELFLKYHENYKVQKAYRLSKKVGKNATIRIMKVYICLKNKGLLRI